MTWTHSRHGSNRVPGDRVPGTALAHPDNNGIVCFCYSKPSLVPIAVSNPNSCWGRNKTWLQKGHPASPESFIPLPSFLPTGRARGTHALELRTEVTHPRAAGLQRFGFGRTLGVAHQMQHVPGFLLKGTRGTLGPERSLVRA